MFRTTIRLGIISGAVGGSVFGIAHYRNELDLSAVALRRFGRAAVTVSRIAFDYKYSRIGIQSNSNEYNDVMSKIHLRSAKLLLDLCNKNGGVFIKVGQHVGAMDYLLPEEYTSTLSVLHSRAPKSSIEEVFQVMKEDLKKEPNDIFSKFEVEPVGAASLAQVHRAVLLNGKQVAVKVQHPKVMSHSKVDIVSMTFLVNAIAWLFPEFSFMWLAEEMQHNLPLELDFLHEGKNAEHVKRIIKFPWLKVPQIYWEFSSPKVLTMEYCEGGQVNDKNYLKENHISSTQIFQQLGELYSEMIFVKGYVHCDPHPGNILVQKKCKDVDIILLDHGLYSKLSDQFRLQYSNLWMSLLSADVEGIKHWAKALGVEEYGLLACIMTARSWKAIQEGINRKQKTTEESNEVRHHAAALMPEIAKLLGKVPREMLLMFKTNDLLRGIETKLGAQGPMSFISMTRCCIRAIGAEQVKRCLNWWCSARVYLWMQWQQTKITVYTLLLQIQNLCQNVPLLNRIVAY
ncbi:aarF domain-containing protein kinase 1-like [Centruroides vittatus]|uniref:aarF domain-containing protein kinase 1-like n=1 Tax=Centruroides vittatus TaxID=120091 RepID=UPI00350FBC75